MRTRAAVLYEMGLAPPYAESRPLRVEEVDLDPPGPGEVLLRMRAAGLCHSDLSVINGDRPRPVPMVLGHEGAGEILETGAGVTGLRAGDHVVTVFVPCCRECVPCRSGRPRLCEPGFKANTAGTLLGGVRRLHRAGTALQHHLGVSAFADYATVSQHSIVRVDENLPYDEAAVFGCAVMTGVGAVLNTAAVPPGASVAVVGLGGVGLAALLGARLAGAATIVACDVNADKLRLAPEFGATHCVDAGSEDAIDRVKSLSAGGVQYAFEMAGAPAAMQFAYAVTGRGGTTVTAGLSHPERHFSVPHVSIVAEERTIKGSYVGGCDPARDIPKYIALYREGKLPIDKLLSERLALDDINAAFDRLAAARSIRQIVVF